MKKTIMQQEMDLTLEAIQIRKEKFESANYFQGVLGCMWAELAIEQGANQIQALRYAIFYNWK